MHSQGSTACFKSLLRMRKTGCMHLLLVTFVLALYAKSHFQLVNHTTKERRNNINQNSEATGLPFANVQKQHTTGVGPQNLKNEENISVGDFKSNLKQSLEIEGTDTGAGDDVMTMFKTRNKQIRKVCLNNTSEHLINSKEFLINSDYKLIWCNIFKSASTTWLYNFLRLKGYSKQYLKKLKKNYLEIARNGVYSRPSNEQLTEVSNSENYTSFIIVRHPFERLLSSYRDKIGGKPKAFYQKTRCDMIGISSGKNKRQQCSPTFSQFVDFVIRRANAGEDLDVHWQRYDTFCSPCQFNFSYVLHFENLPAEEEFLLSEVPGLSTILQPQRLYNSNSDYQKLLPQFYSQLSRGQLDDLIRVYKKDFLLFGYSWGNYLDMVSDT